MKKAFTLAEVMIVLAVIGVLVAILIPTAQNMTPDENLLKFKKANTTLTTAIRELVNSDKYYYDGDLGLDKEGNKIVEAKYFCSTLADILTTKSVNCSEDNLGYNTSALVNLPNIETDEIDGIKIYEYADCMCKNNTTSGEEIKLSDNTIIYTVNPYYHFGSLIDGSDKRLFNLCSNEKRYKFICMDIDNLNEGEDPFGYAIRADGKIIYGARAQAWVERKINDDSEIAIATTDSCAPISLAITPENDVCKTVVQAPTCTPSEHCLACNPNTNLCTTCESGYKLVDGVCVELPCGNLAMEITTDTGKICMTKFNLGPDAKNYFINSGKTVFAQEAEAFLIPSSVATSVEAGLGSCTPSESEFCCWQGTTTTTCDSINGGYSGCTRTVCDWRAANAICSNLNYLGKTWRLATNDEWALIGTRLTDLSIGKNADGLMLCDHATGYSSAACITEERCSGSRDNYCYIGHFWTGTPYNSSVYNHWLYQGVWHQYSNVPSFAFSVRCVSNL